MADSSSIEWTDATWNPVTGCSKVSPGCAHCYAERLAPKVFAGQLVTVTTADGFDLERRKRQFTDVRTHEDRLDQPLRWRKPRRIFVNSMSDLFHEDVPDAFIDRVFAVMALASRHTFQVLTKRPERMREYLAHERKRKVAVAAEAFNLWKTGPAVASKLVEYQNYDAWPLPNVWLGVSVENQHWKSRVIPHLVSTPAAVRFVSVEPLLEDLGDISDWFPREREVSQTRSVWIKGVNWVIVGGESGPQSRPFDLAWARSIIQQCQAAGVPCFVKQLGRFPIHNPNGTHFRVTLKSTKGGDPEEWPADLRVREFPEARP